MARGTEYDSNPIEFIQGITDIRGAARENAGWFSIILVIFGVFLPLAAILTSLGKGRDVWSILPLGVFLPLWLLVVFWIAWCLSGSRALSYWRASRLDPELTTGPVRRRRDRRESEGVYYWEYEIGVGRIDFPVGEDVYRQVTDGDRLTVRFYRTSDRFAGDATFIESIAVLERKPQMPATDKTVIDSAEMADQLNAAKLAWIEWLEYRGCRPSLVEDDDLVDSPAHVDCIRCEDGPIQYVEFVNMRFLAEVRVHLEASWAQGWVPGLHSLLIAKKGPPESGANGGEIGWMGNDLGLGLIDRLNGDESIRNLWNGPTINAMPLVWGSEHEDPHTVSPCEVVLEFFEAPIGEECIEDWTFAAWSAPPSESYDALDGLLGHLVADPEWLPQEEGAPQYIGSVSSPPALYLQWARWLVLPIGVLTASIALIMWRWFWPSMIGIVLSVGGIFALRNSVAKLKVLLRGMNQLSGVDERKWQWSDGLLVDHFYLRVRGLPFEVAEGMFLSVSAGDKILVTFWPEDKRVTFLKKCS